MGRAKLFCLLWVLLMLVCLTFYAGFGGDAHDLITHWWVGLIAIGLGGLAYGVMRILIKKGNWSTETTQLKQI